MTIGEKIKELRLASNLTQEELAKAANTTKQTIHKYETGIISNIPASKIKSMADYLNTTPAYLMGWEEEHEFETPSSTLTAHENKVITAYRSKPEMQAAVDTLLGITKTDNESEERPVRTMRIAALGGGVTEHKYTATDEEIDEAIAYDEDEILD